MNKSASIILALIAAAVLSLGGCYAHNDHTAEDAPAEKETVSHDERETEQAILAPAEPQISESEPPAEKEAENIKETNSESANPNEDAAVKEEESGEYELTPEQQKEVDEFAKMLEEKIAGSAIDPNSPENIAKREAIFGVRYGSDAINKAIEEGAREMAEKVAKYDTNGDGVLSAEEVYNSWTPEEQAEWDAARAENAKIQFGVVGEGLKAAQESHDYH